MSEKPILFNTAMVNAIIEGRKTVTRRIVKSKSKNAAGTTITYNYNNNFVDVYDHDWDERMFDNPQPRYRVGDILYVRETWKKYQKRVGKGVSCHIAEFYGYKADEGNGNNPSEFYDGNWKPSIHMPKEAARIFLRVTNVRVEKLQDISTQGCFNEGITFDYNSSKNEFDFFRELWDSTIKKENVEKYSFKANPWVWVIEFEKEIIGRMFMKAKYINKHNNYDFILGQEYEASKYKKGWLLIEGQLYREECFVNAERKN